MASISFSSDLTAASVFFRSADLHTSDGAVQRGGDVYFATCVNNIDREGTHPKEWLRT